ncbi:hypothetical protein CU097_012281 [Rhizopus azygosporus]|uniref:Uncharacterized protein n=1 Tax=Rhizopus azygosporus TaxID=86630 RepID=A0A367JX83_RHIAZ|nr:hypothetical protein CU097_012281 [Rhizopus azygosporus]
MCFNSVWTESKGAKFRSFFDLIAIKDVSNSHGLEFTHNEISPVASSASSSARRSVTPFTGNLNSETKAHQDNIHFLQTELKSALKERKDYLLQNNINEEKKKWIHKRAKPLQQQEIEHNH